MAARNFSNTASGASLNGAVAAGDVTLALNNYSNFPAAPFTATIGRNQPDEEIVLVTAVSGSTVTVTRGFDSTAAQAHTAGASFEHTAVALDFQESQSHMNRTTGAHGAVGHVVGDTDTQTLTNKTVQALKALATATGAAVEADNVAGQTNKLFRGLSQGTEKFFVDYLGNVTAAGVTGTSGTFTGAVSAATLTATGAASVGGLLTLSGGATVPTGKVLTITDQAGNATDAVNKALLDSVTAQAAATRKLAAHWGSGTTFPTVGVLVGDSFVRSDVGAGVLFRYTANGWRQAEDFAVATVAARNAIPTAVLHAGFRVRVTAQNQEHVYDGTTWRGTAPIAYQFATVNTLSGINDTAYHTVASMTVPDPGFPYTLRARLRAEMQSNATTYPGVRTIYRLRDNTNSYNVIEGFENTGSSWTLTANNGWTPALVNTGSAALTWEVLWSTANAAGGLDGYLRFASVELVPAVAAATLI